MEAERGRRRLSRGAEAQIPEAGAAIAARSSAWSLACLPQAVAGLPRPQSLTARRRSQSAEQHIERLVQRVSDYRAKQDKRHDFGRVFLRVASPFRGLRCKGPRIRKHWHKRKP